MSLAREGDRGDYRDPAQPSFGKPQTKYPTPNVADWLVIEELLISPETYRPIPPKSPHPDYDTNGLILVWQGPVKAANNQVKVVRVYSTNGANEDWFNYSIKYSGDVVAVPVFLRTYVELREDYVALPKAAPLKTVMLLKVTNGGTLYTAPPVVTISAGGGTGATARPIMYRDQVFGLELVTAGQNFTSNPTVTIAAPGGAGVTATATAQIQPAGAVLVKEESERLDGSDAQMASLFVRVHRWYEVLPGPWIPFTRYNNDLGPIQGYRRAVLNTGQFGGTVTATKKTNYEGRDGSAIVLWEIVEYWSNGTSTPGPHPDPGPGPTPNPFPNPPYPIFVWDEYKDERGAVQRTSQIVLKAGTEAATLNKVGDIWTKVWYEAYKENPFLLEMFMETWSTVLVDDLRVTSEHGGAIFKHTERTDEPGALSVETGYLIMNSKLVRISPDEQKLITEKFDPASAVPVLELLQGGTGYGAAPAVGFSGGTCGTAPTGSAVLGFGIASVTVNNGGSGFTAPPAIGFGNGGGGGGFAIAVLGFGVDSVLVTAGGSYTVAPTVAFSGDGTGATGNVVMGFGVYFATVTDPGGRASGTLTSDNTNVSNNDTVTIGTKVYTFKTTLTPAEGEVLREGSADASLLNLIRAINLTGTPGTDYSVAVAHPYVTAAVAVTAHAFAVTAKQPGTIRNTLATTETSANLSWGAATLLGGYSYTEHPRAIFSGDGVGAAADVIMGSPVESITVDERGTSFETPPEVIANGGGSGLDMLAVLGFALDSITVDNPGTDFVSDPVVTIDPPDAGGIQAVAQAILSIFVESAAIQAAGTGYAVNDILDLVGGTFTTVGQLRVTSVGGGGEITGVSVEEAGAYTNVASNPRSVTGGGGTGATFDVTWNAEVGSINVTEPGSGYTVVPGVTITFGGGTGATATAVRETSGELWRVDVINGGVWETTPLLSFNGGGGTGAAATAVRDLSLLLVHRLFVTASGRAYTTAPTISFLYEDNTVPVGLAATATLNSAGEVIAVTMTAAGSGYTTTTPVFSGGTGSGAAATAILATTGSVKSVSVLTPGLYKTVPAVSFIGGGGTGAVGTAVLASTGSVVELLLLTPGSCTVAPTVTFTGANTTVATALYHIGSDEWPILAGCDTDPTYGIVVGTLKQVVPASTVHPGRAALCLGNFVDLTPYDRWKTIRIVSKVNLSTLPCPETFPLRHGLHIPPRLLSIEVVWTGNVSKLVAAMADASTVRVSSGANADIIIRSSRGFRGDQAGYGIREWFFGPPPLAYALSFPIFNPRGVSGSAVITATDSSTGQTQAGPAVSFNDRFQSQVHAVDIRDHMVGFFNVISTDIIDGAQRLLSNQLAVGGQDVLVRHTSQPVSGLAIGPGGVVAIQAYGTPSTMKVSIPQSSPLTMPAGVPLLVDLLVERWRFDVWNVTRIYVPTPVL